MEGRKGTMSSFWKHIPNQKHIKKTLVSPGKNLKYPLLSILIHICKTKKRMSFFSSLRRKDSLLNGSMAVEAAIAVPFFLFFILNILFSFDMLRLHGNMAAAMHQTGNRIAFYGYAYKSLANGEAILTEEIDSLALSEGYARTEVIHLLGREYLDHTCLAHGTAGLHFVKSSIMKEDDVVELVASYKVKPFVKILGFPDFSMENRYYGRAWTGYDVVGRQGDKSATDPMVYITETGTVYHIARNCAYLNPSIEAVSSALVGKLRNESGEKYYDCSSCEGSEYQAVVYVTANGNKIHGSVYCPGLKRTIRAIPLSETAGRSQCSKCGGEN